MTHVFSIPNLTEAQADVAIDDFESDGCSAAKQQQADGSWTVIATCPDAAT